MNDGFRDFQLTDALTRGLHKAGLSEPTPVQRQAIPPALEGRDLSVCAATGSGKTLAYLLPMMHRFIESPSPDTGTRAAILVPTRELARQISNHFLQVGSYTRLEVSVVVGGAAASHQIASLRKNPDILVATPGRLLEHLERGTADLGELEVLVIDEADRMLDMGFAPDVKRIIGYCNQDRQSLLFSATLHHKDLKPVSDVLLRDPEQISVHHHRSLHPDIRHQMLLADDPDHKRALLSALLDELETGRILVFTNTRERAGDLAAFLHSRGTRASALHGELDQRERNRVLGRLQRGDIQVLVASDVAARGLDVPGLNAVINFEVPRSGKDYLHRAGRTGRAGESGTAISLVGAPEWNRMQGIARYLGLNPERRTIKGLEARFKGPRPSKPARKRTPHGDSPKKTAGSGAKLKDRHRDRKNVGKRRKPRSASETEAKEAGLKPLFRKPLT